VLVIPDEAPRQVRVGRLSGEAQFDGLAPGDYSVIALDSTDGIEYTNPESLALYMGSATHVTLGPKQSSSITVQVTHAGK
jgi:hypothetical protein